MPFPQSDIDNWFTHHSPSLDQLNAYREIRTAAKIYAETVNKHVPDSADKTAAMRKIRDSVMAANLAVACHVQPPARPTISDLERILHSPESDQPITINPDGSIS